jgi:methyl-accepting chemotaxis protein
METVALSKNRLEIFESIKIKADKSISIALALYFSFGILLSFFYDTYLIAIGVGGLCLLAYYGSKILFPGSTVYQYVLAAILVVFTAQFVYQMHGLFQMHFIVFVGSALLIAYQNWKLQIPLISLTVISQSTFAYLQYSGNKEIYFTQLDTMDLQTFAFHVALTIIMVGICAFWTFDQQRRTMAELNSHNVLENQLSSVKANIAFAEEISSGKLSVDYTLSNENDELGTALLKMRENLLNASIKEKEERFITVGITKIGEVIRQHSSSLEDLADDFIITLVKYMNVNQGGLFLVEGEQEDQHLKLSSCYAYDRKKFLEKTVGIGEGLIGQCFLEREPIYMTKIPKEYIHITSGLGGAIPTCIFIVPVKTNDEIVGVLELASFTPIEEYKKEFIKKAAENIASSIVSTRVTEKVKNLLSESQQQTEEMRAQEEEMRQNMEELQATQEEMGRKNREMEELVMAAQEKAELKIKEHVQQLELEQKKAKLKEAELTTRIAELQAKLNTEVRLN